MSRIQDIAQRHASQNPLVKTEYTDYGEYMKAQENLTKKVISKEAKTCELCGYPMTWKGHKLTEKEKKWSIHDVCREKAMRLLDRDSGILRDRKEKRLNTV